MPDPQSLGSSQPEAISNHPESPEPAALAASLETSETSAEDANGSAWREELTARLSNYRARRKPRPPRYPSLALRFEAEAVSSDPANSESASGAAFETTSHQALAIDALTINGMTPLPARGEGEWVPPARASSSADALTSVAPDGPKSNHGARIIEFPRSPEFERLIATPPTPSNELAGPVMAPPRILEAPELVPPPPALGGIMMEAAQTAEVERRPGIDVPLQAAPLARRMAAAAIDGTIILLAAGLFGWIFWRVTAIRPPLYQIFGLAAAVPCCLWAAYQYLLLVYGATTPGLRFAGLELARFDGTLADRRLRRWRVLASYLAAVSLGMGYVWVFLDEDALCWHDRITHTYLAPKKAA
ncbi:MAG TPA: RDD family protein [Candidatus Sulfotelmatobacter sp.]|nr:RDD family protein [Candidatus Sulfotelmatobacter sp.]